VLVATALGACVPAPPVEEPAPPVEEPAVEEEVEPITLVVWDSFTGEAENRVAEILNREFEEAHGVKIERVVKSFADLTATVPLALAEPGGPDVAQVNQGRPDMGEIVKAGLLLDLEPYAEKYGWNELFSPGILARTLWTADGKEFGTGNLYGVATTVQNVGVHYRKDKFLELGLSIPETFDEFQAMLAKVKAAGEIPIAFGNLDRWTGIHAYSSIQHVLVSREYLDNFVYGRGNERFDTPENIQAAAILQDWVRKGYFTEDFAGIGYDDSWKSFAAGNGMFLITGTWVTADAAEAAGGPDR
ncbi:raffinose/stachyose/melibiose transport system substrate-binding protein, partial [Candidatus Hakubella thermalkaliphila]